MMHFLLPGTASRYVWLPFFSIMAACYVETATAISSSACYFAADGFCDDSDYNRAECGYDGGDCCESTCVDGPYFTCGEFGYDCIDPLYFDAVDGGSNLDPSITFAAVGAVVTIGICIVVAVLRFLYMKPRASNGAPTPAAALKYAGKVLIVKIPTTLTGVSTQEKGLASP
ncbi:unnamed protein product [Ascophyllum nodosum]